MRNWRELGEVPDSDDDDEESLDYPESQHDRDQQLADQEPPSDDTTVLNNETSPLRSETPKPVKDVDIWDLPSSSEGETFPPRLPSLPSTAKKPRRKSTQPGLPTTFAQDQIAQGPVSFSATQEKDDETTPQPDKQPATKVPSFSDDEISTGYVRISRSEPRISPIPIPSSPLTTLSSSDLPASSPAQPRDQEAPAQTQPQEIPAPDEEEPSRQTGSRPQRSLRQRKPIQQHPYLLEDVNYRKTMKHHGIKPVKVVVSSESTGRRPGEEESQEQEFEAEESQEKSQGRSHGDGTQDQEDPLLPIFDDETSDRDELALSPSPPKTSPGDRLLQASSQTSNGNHTDITGFSGEEEFPSADRLKPQFTRRPLKRQPSRQLSAESKRRIAVSDSSKTVSPRRALIIPDNVWDLSASPSQSRPPQYMSQDLANTPRSPIRNRTAAPRSALQKEDSSKRVKPQAANFPVFDDEEGEHPDSSDSESAATESSSSEEEVIIQNSRKIRGVLPASWLRLDQKKDSSTIVRNRRQSLEFTPAKTPKRGVALPKQTNPGPSTANPFIFNDSEESDSDSAPALPGRDGIPKVTHNVVVIDDDDGASVEEEDHIDMMLPGRKRTATSGLSRGAKKQKRKPKLAFGEAPGGQRTRQPKITQVLGRSKPTTDGTPSRNGAATGVHKRPNETSTKHASKKRTSAPPFLSILDVMEPAAPKFIRIAARTAKQKRNLGKSSPSKKVISLATRRDNVDALSALQDWKSGRTRPRVTVPSTKPLNRNMDVSRPALEEMSSNTGRVRPRDFSSPTDKQVRQSNLDGFVTASHDVQQTPSKPRLPVLHKRKVARQRAPSFRPAQLEINDGEGQGSRLASKKRSLDALFRQSRKAQDASSTHSLAHSLHSFHDLLMVREDRHETEDGNAMVDTTVAASKRSKESNKSRFRKRKAPQYIDLETPQYERAHDPLPPVIVSIPDEMAVPETHDKLKGLCPYGTHYTHHFEVFPLEHGTFFHESTMIGRGYINKAIEEGLSTKIRQHRPIISFVLDEQVLRWGHWDDKTSSEFGILFDWIAEQFSSNKLQGDVFSSRKTSEAAGFVLEYILDSLSVQGDAEQGAFVLRCLEVLSSFTSRFESFDWSGASEQGKMALLEVFARFLVALLAIHSLSHSPGEIESLLTRLASLAIKSLLVFGLEELRRLYSDLQRLSARERGIQPRQVLVNCWVVVMRVLESASIPRSSFWDVTHGVMLKSGVASGLDTQAFERLWQDTFTLLPLGEIDNSGILVPGLRNTIPLEGWTLPQRLMKRVFQVYQLNPRQPPSFNEYCRALVARCHFLVQLWGWRKCTGIIGTIFDFFGSQSLAHLRNEEVYRSPRFIEELHHNPSLSIEPKDRCFHIFIKMLGLVIQRLRQLGRGNEVKNLVTRTLPNHNRQYLKEDKIHQHDLAALRNHHDLLCTLFWAAPPDQRPSIHLIEKLVTPSSAHKEACIINIKAWNQLARFIVSKGEGCHAFKPFGLWRNNIFNQVLDQYLSAASDIEQQYRTLSEQMRGITTDMRDVMIAKNKATAMDVLHSSVRASLDVLKHAPTLEATVFCFNTTQLQKVFTSLDYRSSGFDWSVLRAALETVELYLSRLDEAFDDQYSSEVSDDYDPSQLEDATLLLHDKLAKDFFWMARTTLGIPIPSKTSFGNQTQQTLCAEKTVIIASRIAIKFINSRLTQLSAFFNPGKFGLFPDLPKNLHGQERRYLPLFIATLAKNHMFDFRSIESNMLELWILSIIKPARVLKYENYLAETLQRKNLAFLERATVLVGAKPNYNSSIAYFSCALHNMRKCLRDAGSTRSKQDREEYAKVLNLAMQKMQEDLALLRPEEGEHKAYIGFVRQVISLIKSHGVGICVIDLFFTQPSLDYSPPVQDPRMHTDGIIAYGVRLGEKEVTAVPQLFHYLYSNFKIALGNGKLDQECSILRKAMKNGHIVSFMLQYMIPAIVQASSQLGEVWILLETYVAPLARLLTRSSVARELVGEDIEHAVTGVLMSVWGWLGELRDKSGYGKLSVQQLYLLNLVVTIANAIRPSLRTYLYSEVDPDGFRKSNVEGILDSLAAVFADAHSQIGEALLGCDDQPAAEDVIHGIPSSLADKVRVSELLSGLPPPSATMSAATTAGAGGQKNQRVQEFVRHIVADVRKNWIATDGLVTLRMVTAGPGGRMGMGAFSSTQGQSTTAGSQVGTKCSLASADDLVRGLYSGLGAWSLGNQARGIRNKSRSGGRSRVDDLLF